MHDDHISWFPVASRESLSEETRQMFDTLESKLGFVPNVFRAFAWREERMKKWFAHYEDLMAPTAGLGRADREMISVAVSMQNQCLYCLVSHGFAVRAITKDPVLGDRVTIDYRRAGLPDRQVAMLDFAVKLTNSPATVSKADSDALRALGYADEEIWDIIEIAAMFNYTNRLMSGAGVMPNPEYHGLAR